MSQQISETPNPFVGAVGYPPGDPHFQFVERYKEHTVLAMERLGQLGLKGILLVESLPHEREAGYPYSYVAFAVFESRDAFKAALETDAFQEVARDTGTRFQDSVPLSGRRGEAWQMPERFNLAYRTADPATLELLKQLKAEARAGRESRMPIR